MDLSPISIPGVSVAPGARAHVRGALGQAADVEPCGYLLGLRAEDGALEIVAALDGRNLHRNPRAGFLLGPDEQLAVRRQARSRGLEVIGTWHGHLHGPARPGTSDLRGHAASGLACMLIVARKNDGTPHVRVYVTGDDGVREVAIDVSAT